MRWIAAWRRTSASLKNWAVAATGDEVEDLGRAAPNEALLLAAWDRSGRLAALAGRNYDRTPQQSRFQEPLYSLPSSQT